MSSGGVITLSAANSSAAAPGSIAQYSFSVLATPGAPTGVTVAGGTTATPALATLATPAAATLAAATPVK